jgi:predicted amino acid-binding ACT domain protein
MTSQRKESVVLLIQCKDRKGIVARVSGFIHDFGGNILDSDHHTDEETNDFLMRMECSTEGLQIAPDQISEAFAPIAKVFEMRYEVHQTSRRTRVGMMVSKQDHCLADLLQRHRRDELRIDIPLIISNHDTCHQRDETGARTARGLTLAGAAHRTRRDGPVHADSQRRVSCHGRLSRDQHSPFLPSRLHRRKSLSASV